MIFFSAVSDDDDRDVERRGAHYVTPRFFLTALPIVVIVLVLGFVFVLRPAIDRGNWVKAQDRLKALAKGLSVYAEANNDGLPPVFLPNAKDVNGRPITWANQIFDYVGRMEIFNSPAMPEQGNTILTRTMSDGERLDVALSFGMLASADTARLYEIHDDAILLAETIGAGVSGSYNPMPLGGRDGFMIGYDNSNFMPDAATEFVTRLAFVGEGSSPLGLKAVREKGIVGIRADGSLAIFRTASEAFPVSKTAGAPSGQWTPY